MRLWIAFLLAVEVALGCGLPASGAQVEEPPMEPAPALAARETLLDRARAELRVGPDELRVDPEWQADPYRMAAVKNLLADFAATAAYVERLADAIALARPSLSRVLSSAAAEIDVPLGTHHPIAPPEEDPLVRAIYNLEKTVGTPMTDHDLLELTARAEKLPDDITDIAATLVAAVTRAWQIAEPAFEDLSENEIEIIHSFHYTDFDTAHQDHEGAKAALATLDKVNLSLLFQAADQLSVSLDSMGRDLTKAANTQIEADEITLRAARKEWAHGDCVFSWETSLGKIFIGGSDTTIYLDDALLILDLGGNDAYLCSAGGARGPERLISICVDLDGDDTYLSQGDFSQGAALGGVGILLDLAGNDTYRAKSMSQGSATVGVGILADLRGDDSYRGERRCQGAATFGAGILMEERGRDRYDGDIFCQGFGNVSGIGMILEGSGNDKYFCGGKYEDEREKGRYKSLGQGFGFGTRPAASGGIGALFDFAGDDTYTAEYFSQGSAYWFALGILFDAEGNDHYNARRYSQGAATHLAVGCLFDGAGDDTYSSWGVSQGCGHDLAFGLLRDSGGDDNYFAEWFSQGMGDSVGVGMLEDLAGNDNYRCIAETCQGFANFDNDRNRRSLGFLLDAGGTDTYSLQGANGAVWRAGQNGMGIDHETDSSNN